MSDLIISKSPARCLRSVHGRPYRHPPALNSPTEVLSHTYPFPNPKNNAEREANCEASDEYQRQEEEAWRPPRLGEGAGMALTDTAETAPADDGPGFRNVGCQIVGSPEAADEIAQRLREAVGEILDDYTDDDVFAYGVD
jgi:hypothetical protein